MSAASPLEGICISGATSISASSPAYWHFVQGTFLEAGVAAAAGAPQSSVYHPDHLRVELGRATLGPNNSHADFLPLFGVLLNVSVVHRRDCSHRLIEAGSKS